MSNLTKVNFRVYLNKRHDKKERGNKMERVRCIKCGSEGYTASPEFMRCHLCGGRHEIINEKPHVTPITKETLLYIKRLELTDPYMKG